MTGPPIQGVIGTQTELDESRRSWGMVFFKEDGTPFFGTELAVLTDVDLTGLTDGDILVWDATAEKWVRDVVDSDAWHAIDGSGEPAFGSGWSNSAADITGDDPGTRPVAAFRKIPGAVVLRGIVAGTYGTPIFTLPVGYRPSATHLFMTTGQIASTYRIHVEPNGQVLFSDGPTTTPTWLVLTTVIPLDPS